MSDIDTTELDKKLVIRKDELVEKDISLSDKEYWVRIREICAWYDDICDRMKMEATFTYREVYMFSVFTAYLISEIDKNIQLEWIAWIRSTLSSIRFNKSEEDVTRWKAGHRNILINTFDMRDTIELFEVMTHEFMHVLDLGVLDDPHSEKNTQYKEFGEISFWKNDRSLKFYSISWKQEHLKRNSVRESDIISGYWATNVFEEFAEFGNARINHQVPLLAIAREDDEIRKKYFLFKELFGERYIHKDIETFREKNLEQRPYDTSRRHDTVHDLSHH